jgi:hypothetical protein
MTWREGTLRQSPSADSHEQQGQESFSRSSGRLLVWENIVEETSSMRRVAIVVALFLLCLPVFAQSTTQNLNLQLPAHGATNWDSYLRTDMSLIDTSIGSLQTPYAGIWSNNIVYSKGQFANYMGGVYISLVGGNLNHEPDTSPLAWMAFISGGDSNIGAFTDNGTKSSYPVNYAMVGLGSVLEGAWVSTTTPWVGCTSAATVSIVDNLGNVLTTFTTAGNYGAGSTPYSYMTGGGNSSVNTIVASGATGLQSLFTSPTGCTSYATGVNVNFKLYSGEVNISPMPARVATNGTVQFSGYVSFGSDTTDATTVTSWSVDGVVGGNSTVGTISTSGLYTAPATSGTHSIQAASTAVTGLVGYSSVTVTASPS